MFVFRFAFMSLTRGPWRRCKAAVSCAVLYCTIYQVSFFLVPATCRAHTPPIYQLVHFFLLAVSYLLLGSRLLGASGPRPPSPRASNSLLHLSRLESFSRGERSWGLCKTSVFGSLNQPASRISLHLALGCPLQKRGPILDRHLYYNTPPRPSLQPYRSEYHHNQLRSPGSTSFLYLILSPSFTCLPSFTRGFRYIHSLTDSISSTFYSKLFVVIAT